MISERIHATLVRWTLLICKSLLVTAFLAVIISAAARYFLSTGSVKLDDIQHYSFGSLILLAIVVAFWSEKHVKIELVQSKLTSNAFQMIWAVLLVCIPMILIVIVSVPAVRLSWINLEGSAEPGGLGGVFLLKTLLPVCGLLFIYGAIQKIFSLRNSDK